MGSSGSLPNNLRSQEPPPLPPPFFTGNHPQSGNLRMSSSSCESQPDRRSSGLSTATFNNTGVQRASTSGSMKNEEWWHHKPGAPSTSDLRPQQETLLTYAAQMTGWQSGCDRAAGPSMHLEAMELARTVSHLAAANQQLATAHTALLAQLESLYLELNRERELRFAHEVRLSRGKSSSDDESSREKLANRTGNLEKSDKSLIRQQSNRDRKFLGSAEESRLFVTKDIGVQSEELEHRLGPSWLIGTENSVDESDDCHLNLEYREAVDRIHSLENALATCRVENVVDSSKRNEMQSLKTESINKLPGEYSIFEVAHENIDGSQSGNSTKPRGRDVKELLAKIEILKNDRFEYRERNVKLANDLEKQVFLMKNLQNDSEILRSRYEETEASLTERQEKLDALIVDYDNAELEKTRLSKELHTANLEAASMSLRISNLERELADSAQDRIRLTKADDQESSRLRGMLSQEIGSGKEQARALEAALKEIQRLNELIVDGKKNVSANDSTEILENGNEPTPIEEVLDPEIAVARSSNMEEFRKELSLKREARQRAIAAVSSEMDRLRRELDAEKEAHSETSRVLDLLKSGQTTSQTIDNDAAGTSEENSDDKIDWRMVMKPNPELNNNEADAQTLTDILKVSDELRSNIRLQTEKIDDLRYHLESEAEGNKNRIASLKETAKKSRESLNLRERQTNKLKNLLAQILAHLGDPRFRIEILDDVRSEHDRQLEDIRRLRLLYDDRLRVLVDLRDSASKELAETKDKLKNSLKDNVCLEEDLKKAEEKIDNQDMEISNLESQLGLTKADCRDLQNQMSVINGLFTQMLLSASSADMDLDRLTRLLQENHDLISDMAREEGTEAAALPKLLLDIVEQVEGRSGGKSADGEGEKKDDGPQEENIAHNLPKVWRVLLELLSCHAVDSPPVTPASLSTDLNSCYKSVDTPSGPRLVISVSKTYIRLKELILEKKHLEKEMNRMKQLNTHLESKLGEQEKRLSTVSTELSKTWNVVGRMQAQHQQLHTHEKILRYELQQKRKMLQELKQELEYCREKWESARQKNTNTEIEWRSLRREFAARKSLAAQDSFNNSGESGFSDERGDDSDEEDEAVEGRSRVGPRRRTRKENPRAPTPDTESEQPTDTEVSETKTTPETNVSTEDVSIASTSAISPEESSVDPEVPKETVKLSPTTNVHERKQPINSLEDALQNVIQNLIGMDVTEPNDLSHSRTDSSTSSSATPENGPTEETENSPEMKMPCMDVNSMDKTNIEEDKLSSNETNNSSGIATVSVFSIGPFLPPTAAPAKSVQFSDPLVVGPSIQSTVPCSHLNQENSNEAAKVEENILTENKPTEESLIVESSKNSVVPIGECNPLTQNSQGSSDKAGPSEELEIPSTSTGKISDQAPPKPPRSHEQVLAARADRLKRLEEQADWLMKKMSATSKRGSALSTRLEELHEVYGEAPAPPPMPDVLPNVRIPLETRNQQLQAETIEEDGPTMPDLP